MNYKAEKIIHMTETTDIDVVGITLLSEDEYHEFKSHIPIVDFDWWLRTAIPYYAYIAGNVLTEGLPYINRMDSISIGSRPALKIRNLSESKLKLDDDFALKGREWHVIADNYALCNDNIGNHCYRADWRAEDSDVFENSDILAFLNEWWELQE